ncbi:MAG: carboxypeptidase-like regulatory domain-containing protein, partial [Planctomycetota bacterium]
GAALLAAILAFLWWPRPEAPLELPGALDGPVSATTEPLPLPAPDGAAAPAPPAPAPAGATAEPREEPDEDEPAGTPEAAQIVIVGRVIDDQGEPVAGAKVEFVSDWGRMKIALGSVVTDAEGRFRHAPKGSMRQFKRWTLTASHPHRTGSVNGVWESERPAPVEIVLPAADSGVIQLRGRAVDEVPLPKGPGVLETEGGVRVVAAIWLRPHDGGAPMVRPQSWIAVGEEFWTVLDGVPPGRWTVRVVTPLTACVVREEEIEVFTGRTTQVVCDVAAGGAVHGIVRDTFTGKPVSLVRVVAKLPSCNCAAKDHPEVYWPPDFRDYRGHPYSPMGVVHPRLCPQSGRVAVQAFTEREGTFRLAGLPAGTVELTLYYYGREVSRHTVATGTEPVELRLDGRPALTLTPPKGRYNHRLRVYVDGVATGAAEREIQFPGMYRGEPLRVHALSPGKHLIWVEGNHADHPTGRFVGELFEVDYQPGTPLARELQPLPAGTVYYHLIDAGTGERIGPWRAEFVRGGRVIRRADGRAADVLVQIVPLEGQTVVRLSVEGYAPAEFDAAPRQGNLGEAVPVRLTPK